MYKFLMIAVAILFSGCSTMTINEQMCDRIALDPKATVPQECVPYIEEEAAKASLKETEKLDPADTIEFTKE